MQLVEMRLQPRLSGRAALHVSWGPEAPAEVRGLFLEASTCEEAGALRGAAGLLRACVEAIVNEQGVSGRNLRDKIDGLQAKVPSLDANMIRDLHDARLTGNWSLHD